MNNKAEVHIIETDDKWYGMTYKDDKEIVVNAIKDMIDKGIYKCNLWDWLKDQDERLVLDLLFKNYNFIDYGIEIK